MSINYIENLVSVIIPIYNRELFIGKTIESVLNQTYKNFELILIDDGSTDSTFSIIKEYKKKDSRIVIINQKKNQGIAKSRNLGIKEAKGQFLAFLDSDDLWYPEKLYLQLAFMKENKIGFSYTNIEMINEEGDKLNNKVHIPTKITYKELLKNTAIPCMTVILDRNYVGEFEVPIAKRGSDMATWLKILREKNMSAYGLDKVLAQYRRHECQISYNKFKMIKTIWNTYRNLEKLPFHYSIYCFIHYAFRGVRRYYIKF